MLFACHWLGIEVDIAFTLCSISVGYLIFKTFQSNSSDHKLITAYIFWSILVLVLPPSFFVTSFSLGYFEDFNRLDIYDGDLDTFDIYNNCLPFGPWHKSDGLIYNMVSPILGH